MPMKRQMRSPGHTDRVVQKDDLELELKSLEEAILSSTTVRHRLKLKHASSPCRYQEQ